MGTRLRSIMADDLAGYAIGAHDERTFYSDGWAGAIAMKAPESLTGTRTAWRRRPHEGPTASCAAGVWLGAWLTLRQQRVDAATAEQEQQRAQMQQLVIAAVSAMIRARTLYQEKWLSRTTRLRVVGMAAIDFWSTWRIRGGN
jgi:hypothetical protein